MATEPFIKISAEQVKDLQRKLDAIAGETGIVRAMAAALNKTASKAKTELNKEVRADVRLTAAEVRDILRGPNDNPANKATFSNLRSKVTARKRGARLQRFQTAEDPVKVKVKPTGRAKTLPGAFIIPLSNTTVTGIFIREGESIRHLYGPSVSQVFQSEKEEFAPIMQAYLAAQLKIEAEGIIRRKLAGLI